MDQPRLNQLGGRHIPRKLSLVERLDSASLGSSSRHVTTAAKESSFPEPLHVSLTPILQAEEPNSAKADLELRVKSWYATSSAAATPLVVTNQVSLDPVNMPSTMMLKTSSKSSAEHAQGDLNLDDFMWSVSSSGPSDYTKLESPVSWSRVPSVHLDRRLEGSIMLSPSTRTSWGPDDDSLSVADSLSRLPSPDIAMRLLEDAPLTPSTATSWGPPLYYPNSPTYISRPPSVDLGYRSMFTPSSSSSFPAISLRLAQEHSFSHYDTDSDHTHLVFPYFTVQDVPSAYDPIGNTVAFARLLSC